ncbi:MAG: hypothetical protein MMC33_004158 [Icmadophila ericetorum]|nr:hypothetical protein [Icmadophila ericetorum]
MTNLVADLEREYCPPIDSALFIAILNDYDLSEEVSIARVRATLDTLKESADAEGTAAFDPSGSSGPAAAHEETGPEHELGPKALSWNGDVLSGTEETDLASLTQSIKSWAVGGDNESSSELEEEDEESGETRVRISDYDQFNEELDTTDKEALLSEIFPTLKPFDISYTLKKRKNDFDRTVEELLSQVFLAEGQYTEDDGALETQPMRGIDGFIDHKENDPPTRRANRRRQKKHRRSSSIPAVTVIPHYSRPDPSQLDDETLPQRKRTPAENLGLVQLPLSPTTNNQNRFSLLAQENCATSRSAYLRTASPSTTPLLKPFQGAVRAHYAAIGSSSLKIAHQISSRAASELVATQSPRPLEEIDLHGVNVSDAIRIARQRVQEWWDRGEAEWAREGKVMGGRAAGGEMGMGYRIVTGVGRHSEGGRGKLGPAVGQMLVREGWRVEVLEGVLVVWGRARRN